MGPARDFVHRFSLADAGVRGVAVRLDEAWRELLEQADYPAAVERLLGEAVAASALLAGTIKFRGRLSIQLRTAGPLRLLFAECTDEGHVRGVARCDDGIGDAVGETADLLDPAGAQLAITIDQGTADTRYQGLVALEGARLSDSLEGYFARSEQLPTRIVLAVAGGRCAGLLLQPVANQGGVATTGDPDGWNRVGHLLATLSDAELLNLPAMQLLNRLFHAEGLELHEARPLSFHCSCSPERVGGMLRALGRDEAEAALNDEGRIEVTCEFCNRRYALDRVDLAQLFAGAPAIAAPAGRH